RCLARSLHPARRAGLDDRRAAHRSVERDHPHRQARRARAVPHGRRAQHPARPRARCDPGQMDVPRRGIARLHQARPLLDLRRRPSLRARMNAASIDTGHAGHMDAIYRSQRHIYDLTRKYYLLGRDALIDGIAPPPGGSVLEIGCGTGRNLIAAARRWPDARFYGIDISEAMLQTARAKVAKAGLSDRIVLAQGDATAFDAEALFGIATFDRFFPS